MLLRTSCASRAARRPGSDHTAIARVATAMRPNLARSMSDMGQPRRLSDLGMSASPPTPDASLRGNEATLRAINRSASWHWAKQKSTIGAKMLPIVGTRG